MRMINVTGMLGEMFLQIFSRMKFVDLRTYYFECKTLFNP